MVDLQAWLAWLESRSTNGSKAFKKRRGVARIGNISIFQSHAQSLEACACARTRNYIIKSAELTVQRWLAQLRMRVGVAALK
jgi:hypothetical protein